MSRAIKFPDAVPELVGKSLHLRELTEDDIPAWFERATDAEAADLAGDPVPESIEKGPLWLQRHRERFQQKVAVRWAIVPKGATASVGTVGVAITSNEQRTAELGIVIARAYWGQGLGTAAAQLAIQYGFNVLGLVEVHAEVLQRNLASLRLLEKAGFHLLRAIPGDPQLGADAEDCFLYVLSSHSAGAA